MSYFPLWFRLDRRDHYLIWIGSEKDSVVSESDGHVPTFDDLQELRSYVQLKGFTVEEEFPVLHDLDWVESWCTERERSVDCEKALAAWNLFSDVAASLGRPAEAFREIDNSSPSIYQKLFWGNNVPAVTPPGKVFVPEWADQELEALRHALGVGLALFRKSTDIGAV